MARERNMVEMRRELDRREAGQRAALVFLDCKFADRKSDPAGYRAARMTFELFTGEHAELKVCA